MTTMQSSHAKVAILGGGLAGLSTLWHLRKKGVRECFLFERESRVGGLARSEKVRGFIFDYTGHLLHFRNEKVRSLVFSLLKGNHHSCTRNSWIYSKEVYTRYPFQTNLFGLPVDVVRECVSKYIKANEGRLFLENSSCSPTSLSDYSNFQEFVLRVFGEGIGRHFMFPYNEKLWTVPPASLTCDWMGRFVPATSLDQVLEGALADLPSRAGYNSSFIYPLAGGIEALPRAFAEGQEGIYCGYEAVSVDLEERTVSFQDGTRIKYEVLVSCLPLPVLAKMCHPLPASLAELAADLRWAGVYNLNLGVDRELGDRHWIYFPEPEWLFYRVGFPHNFSPSQAPKGCGSLYAEVSYSPSHPLDKENIAPTIKRQLQQIGILRGSDKILAECALEIPCAYVVYDHNYRRCVPPLKKILAEQGIYTIGRYGAWEYGSMEDAIRQGMETAEEIGLMSLGGTNLLRFP